MNPLPGRAHLFEAVFDAEAFAAAVGEVSRAIGARSFLAGFMMADGVREAAVSSGWWSDDLIADYYANHALDDPWNRVQMSDWQPNRARSFANTVSERDVEDSRLWQTFIVPSGDDTFRAIGLGVDVDGGRGGYGFQRGRDQPDFDADALARLDSIAGDLGRALALRARIQGMERALLSREQALDSLSDAMIVLRGDGRIESVNAAGEAALREGRWLTLHGGRMVAASPHDRAAWHDALARVKREQTGAVRLRDAGGVAMVVSLVALPRPGMMPAVLVSFAAAAPASQAVRLRMAYGLSDSEAQIALMLAEGSTPAEIAECRGTSLNTVRVQLRAIAEKMDCSRQADITARVAALPRLATDAS